MTGRNALIAGLVAVLLIVLFYFFAWQPRTEEIAELDQQRETVEQQQAQLESEIRRLQQVRQDAAEAESQVVAAESIVPRDLAIPSALRQLVLAADESGVELASTTWSRPSQVEDAEPGLAAIDMQLQVMGGYYQIVDFLRRVEDPAITPRGVTWQNLTLSEEEYPTLVASVSGRLFALLPVPPQPAPAETPSPGAEDADGAEGAGGTEGTEQPTEPEEAPS